MKSYSSESRWNKRAVLAVLCAGLVSGSCLFSTTPPKTKEPTTGSGDPGLALVTGKVLHRLQVGEVPRVAPHRDVEVRWMTRDSNRPGQYDLQRLDRLSNGRDGTYESSYRGGLLHRVEVRTTLCAYDPVTYNECCVPVTPGEPPPIGCPLNCGNIWGPWIGTDAAPGSHVQENLVMTCLP